MEALYELKVEISEKLVSSMLKKDYPLFIMILVLLVIYNMVVNPIQIMGGAVSLPMLCVGAAVLLVAFDRIIVNKSIVPKQYKKYTENFGTYQNLLFYKDGVNVSTDRDSTYIEYKDITKIVNAGRTLYIFSTKYRALIVPAEICPAKLYGELLRLKSVLKAVRAGKEGFELSGESKNNEKLKLSESESSNKKV